MSGVSTYACGRYSAVYFTEDVPALPATRLAAVALWRAEPASSSASAPAAEASSWRPPERGWSWSAGDDGAHATLYHRQRRVVQVLGTEYALPASDLTLVLLIDGRGGVGDAPTVAVRTVPAPTAPPWAADPSLSRAEQAARFGEALDRERQLWTAALEADAEVRAFLAGSPPPMGPDVRS